MVHPTLDPSETSPAGEIPPGYEIKTLDQGDRDDGQAVPEQLFVKRIPEMTGDMISNAYERTDMYGKPEVGLLVHLTSAGKERFAEVTEDIVEGGPEDRPPSAASPSSSTASSTRPRP